MEANLSENENDKNSVNDSTSGDEAQYNTVPEQEPAQEQASSQEEDIHQQFDKLKSEYLYLRAEFDNYRKQAVKERSQASKFGAESLARDLLGVLDILEAAINSEVTPETLQNYKMGVEMTFTEFKNALSNNHITMLDSDGIAFDPNLHEAVSSEETDSVPPGHIVKTFRRAYKYHDKLLRPAQVVVATAGAGSDKSSTGAGPEDDTDVYEIDLDEE